MFIFKEIENKQNILEFYVEKNTLQLSPEYTIL